MEYTFISKDTFNGIIEHYITKLPATKQKKALIDFNLLNEIKEILLNPKNNTISSKNTRDWAKKKFKLEEIIELRILTRNSGTRPDPTRNFGSGQTNYPTRSKLDLKL